jgi:hypothetical protein
MLSGLHCLGKEELRRTVNVTHATDVCEVIPVVRFEVFTAVY